MGKCPQFAGKMEQNPVQQGGREKAAMLEGGMGGTHSSLDMGFLTLQAREICAALGRVCKLREPGGRPFSCCDVAACGLLHSSPDLLLPSKLLREEQQQLSDSWRA